MQKRIVAYLHQLTVVRVITVVAAPLIPHGPSDAFSLLFLEKRWLSAVPFELFSAEVHTINNQTENCGVTLGDK